MYKCKPERNVKQVVLLMVGCVFGLIAIFTMSIYWESQGGLLKFIGFLFAVLAIYVIIRFTMTEMEYALDGGTFVITKTVGNKRTVQGALDLANTVALVTKEEYREKGLNKNLSTICNYSQNIGGKHWFYVFEFAGKRAVVEFEPNDTFVAIMKDEIEKALASKEDGTPGGNDSDDCGGLLI